jgi:hemerythrin
MEDKVHNDDKTSNKITVLYILKFLLSHIKQEDKKILAQTVANIPSISSALTFFKDAILIC